MDTINRLLHKQEPKRKKKVVGDDDLDEDGNARRAPAAFVRYIQTTSGSTLLVPDQWIEAPVGEIFKDAVKPLKAAPSFTGRLVQELD